VNPEGESFEILKKILEILNRIEKRLERIEGNHTVDNIDPFALLELPDNLRTTLIALLKAENATAEGISSITGRGRAIESHYLNFLVKMGYVEKKRDGRKVIFTVKNS